MPPTLPARRRSSHTSPRTSSVRPPMRSRPPVLPLLKERAKAQGNASAGGSAISSRRRFASSSSTTSGYGTTSAGRCSAAESASGHQHCQGRQGHVHPLTTAAPPDEQRAGPTRLAHMCCQRPHQPRGPQASPLTGHFLALGTEAHVTAAATTQTCAPAVGPRRPWPAVPGSGRRRGRPCPRAGRRPRPRTRPAPRGDENKSPRPSPATAGSLALHRRTRTTWCSSVDPFRGDQPGARVERDALTRLVPRKKSPQPGTRAPRLARIAPRKHVARRAHAADDLVRRLGVRSVEDRLVDVFEPGPPRQMSRAHPPRYGTLGMADRAKAVARYGTRALLPTAQPSRRSVAVRA